MSNPKTLTVSSFSRIHISLLDMGRQTLRACGGIGFATDAFPTRWAITEAEHDQLLGVQELDATAQGEVANIFERVRAVVALPPTRAQLISHAPQHSGFGAKTSLLVSLVCGLNRLFELGLSEATLQATTGRGGTSGVGIHSALVGGIIWDGGHDQSAYPKFAPSSSTTATSPPPLVARWDFPDKFELALFFGDGKRISGSAETDFFSRVCPIGEPEVAKAFFAIFHGVLPGLVSKDLRLLREGLRQVHTSGFKAHELRAQSPNVIDLYKNLSEWPRVAVGLSSLGPLIYCILDRNDTETKVAMRLATSEGRLPPFMTASGQNQGLLVRS